MEAQALRSTRAGAMFGEHMSEATARIGGDRLHVMLVRDGTAARSKEAMHGYSQH